MAVKVAKANKFLRFSAQRCRITGGPVNNGYIAGPLAGATPCSVTSGSRVGETVPGLGKPYLLVRNGQTGHLEPRWRHQHRAVLRNHPVLYASMRDSRCVVNHPQESRMLRAEISRESAEFVVAVSEYLNNCHQPDHDHEDAVLNKLPIYGLITRAFYAGRLNIW